MTSKCVLSTSLFLIVVSAALSACGGGGSAAPSGSDKYVGIWVGATCSPGIGGFYNQVLDVTKVSDASYQTVGAIYEYTASNCSGTGTVVPGDSFTTVFTIVGSKAASGKTVDKVTSPSLPPATALIKALAYAEGRVLQLGDGSTSGVDSDGFPVSLEPQIFNKR